MTVANAPAYHAEYRCYAGPTFASLLTAGLTASLSGWSAPTVGTPDGWTDISARVHWPGGLRQTLGGNSITWEAELQGENYAAAYLALGLAVALWRRYWTPAGGWEPWVREYVGQWAATDDQNDYRNGKAWRRAVTGVQYDLSRRNAPPLAFGPLDVTTGASVEVWNGDVLPDPTLEAASGEYAGAPASVGGGNIVDGKLTTLFISNSAPGTVEDKPDVWEDGGVIVSEVMFQPVNGWPQSACWWVEVYSDRNRGLEQNFGLVAGRAYNATTGRYETAHYVGHQDGQGRYAGAHGWGDKGRLSDGRFGIVCGNRALFELYTGGAPDAQFILDASLYNTAFTLDPDDGFVGVTTNAVTGGDAQGTIIWTPGGVARKADVTHAVGDGAGSYWYGAPPGYAAVATFDSATLPANGGYSVRRALGVNRGIPPTHGDPSVFSAVRFPSPGGHTTKATPVVLRVELPENVCYLTQSVTADTTALTLDNYVGWLEDGGKGNVEGDIFTFAARTVNGLTGVTWDAGGSHDHEASARAYPYAQTPGVGGALSWANQTGYPLSELTLFRRRPPAILEGRVYLSPLMTARQYEDETGWQDYPWSYSWANSQELTRRLTLADGNTGTNYQWVHVILIVIDKMADSGRAKLNEIRAVAIHAASNGLPADAVATAAGLARYLLTSYCGIQAADFVDRSYSLAHRLGAQRLSPIPMTRILNDLARQTGCLVYYAPDGVIYWLDDPWWPERENWTRQQIWTTAHLSGELRVNEQAQTVDYVVVNAQALDGDLPHPIRVTYPPPPGGGKEPPAGSQAVEIGGVTVASETDARRLAEMEYLKARATATTTGAPVGVYDLRPGQLVAIVADYGQAAACAWDWQIADVTTQRRAGAGGRAVTQSLGLRLYAKGEPT